MVMVNRKNLELLALGQRVCRNHIQALRLNGTGLCHDFPSLVLNCIFPEHTRELLPINSKRNKTKQLCPYSPVFWACFSEFVVF